MRGRVSRKHALAGHGVRGSLVSAPEVAAALPIRVSVCGGGAEALLAAVVTAKQELEEDGDEEEETTTSVSSILRVRIMDFGTHIPIIATAKTTFSRMQACP